MDAKQFLLISASMLASVVAAGAQGEEAQRRHIQIAEIEVDAAQLENYRAAVNEQIEAAIRTEPGVLALYAVAGRRDPHQGLRSLSRRGRIQVASRDGALQKV